MAKVVGYHSDNSKCYTVGCRLISNSSTALAQGDVNAFLNAKTYDDDSNAGSKWERMTQAEQAAFVEKNKTPKSNVGSKWDRMTETEKATFETNPRPARTYDDDSNEGSKWDRMSQAEKESFVTRGGVTRKKLIANWADTNNEYHADLRRLEVLDIRERSGGKVFFYQWRDAEKALAVSRKKLEDTRLALKDAYIHPVVAKNADALHNKECKANHPSECSYHQNSWEEPSQLRNQYYIKAEEAFINS